MWQEQDKMDLTLGPWSPVRDPLGFREEDGLPWAPPEGPVQEGSSERPGTKKDSRRAGKAEGAGVLCAEGSEAGWGSRESGIKWALYGLSGLLL